MIDIDFELSSALDAQDRYDIIGMAMDAADDNGFINSFVFERALYCFAVITLYPERKDEIAPVAAQNPIAAWNKLIEDGSIDKMWQEYRSEINKLAAEGFTWYEEYSEYAHSARGILEIVQQFTGNIVENGAKQLAQTAQTTGVSDLLETAED